MIRVEEDVWTEMGVLKRRRVIIRAIGRGNGLAVCKLSSS